jgi:ribonuclease P protein component
VFEQGRRTRGRYFTVVIVPGREHSRLGLAVGRRTSHRAVVRNRIKRIARDVFRHIQLPALDIVVVAHAGLEAIPAACLRTDLESALLGLNS